MENITRREMVINVLRSRGYEPEEQDIERNGVSLHGIVMIIKSENVDGNHAGHVFWMENFREEMSAVEIADEIEDMHNDKKKREFPFDIRTFTNRERFASSLFIGLQKAGSREDLITRPGPFKGSVQYLYLRLENGDVSGAAKVSLAHLERNGISVEEAWDAAQHNTCAPGRTRIENLAEMMGNLFGGPCMDDAPTGSSDVFVITNADGERGASQIMDTDSIKKYFPGFSRFVAIPSSIHECLLIPAASADEDLSRYDEMVQEINATEVSAEEVLSDTCFLLTVA